MKPEINGYDHECSITINSEGATITLPRLSLSEQHPSRKFTFTIEKMPINMEVGKSYATQDVLIDEDSQLLAVVAQARELSSIAQNQRPRLIVQLLKRYLSLASRSNINQLRLTDPASADWVQKNVSETAMNKHVPLSQIIKHGYAICTHHSATYLWLAQEAGLKGAIIRSAQSTLINIMRTDNQGKLFHSADVGAPVAAHAWVEILLENGAWMPVDPTTGLVGDTPENLEMFKQANYLCNTINQSVLSGNATPPGKITLSDYKTSVPAGQQCGTWSFMASLAKQPQLDRPSTLKALQFLPPANNSHAGEAVITIRSNNGGDVAYTVINGISHP